MNGLAREMDGLPILLHNPSAPRNEYAETCPTFAGGKNVALNSRSGDSPCAAGRADVLTDLERKGTRRKSTNGVNDGELRSCEFGFFPFIISLSRKYM